MTTMRMIQAGTLTRVTMILAGCMLLATSADAQEAKQGVWKWVVPPVKMQGTFDDHDPIGLVAGKLIPADCSFNWTDPDTHKLYCFTSATSLVYFLDSPQTYLAEAEKNWLALKGKSGRAQ
jgi:hypothetical protein